MKKYLLSLISILIFAAVAFSDIVVNPVYDPAQWTSEKATTSNSVTFIDTFTSKNVLITLKTSNIVGVYSPATDATVSVSPTIIESDYCSKPTRLIEKQY